MSYGRLQLVALKDSYILHSCFLNTNQYLHELERILIRTNYYSTRNFLYVARKHANLFNQFLVHLGTCIFGVKHVVKYVYGNSEDKKIARGFFEGIRDFYSGKMGKYTE